MDRKVSYAETDYLDLKRQIDAIFDRWCIPKGNAFCEWYDQQKQTPGSFRRRDLEELADMLIIAQWHERLLARKLGIAGPAS